MTAQQNISLIRKLFDFYNKNDPNNLNIFDEILAPNLQFHDPAQPNTKNGLDTLKQAEKGYIKAFPNKKTSIDDIFATEDRVAVRWTSKGSQKGEFHGNAPTNQEFTISGISLYRISNNKITDIWQIWDRQGLMDQISKSQMAKTSR
jgi:steroid delta-isomerase-like uncharacterized protein